MEQFTEEEQTQLKRLIDKNPTAVAQAVTKDYPEETLEALFGCTTWRRCTKQKT